MVDIIEDSLPLCNVLHSVHYASVSLPIEWNLMQLTYTLYVTKACGRLFLLSFLGIVMDRILPLQGGIGILDAVVLG